MKFKKTLSALLAGLMLAGSALAVSAGSRVYSYEDIAPRYTTPYYYGYNPYYYNNYYPYYYANNVLDRGVVYTAPTWNALTGRYDNCACAYCTGTADLTGYYWVNGVLHTAKDYYVNYATHTVAVTPAASGETSKETGVTYYESSIPSSVIKRKPAAEETEGSIIVTNPALLGSYNKPQTVYGTYYAYDKVDLNAYFNTNSMTLHLTQGEIQNFGTGFKMISADSSIVKVVNDYQGQKLVANGVGSTSVYLYTGGGVPFMKLSVTVVNYAYTPHTGHIDVEVGSWRLDKSGDCTPIVVRVDEDHAADPVKLSVVKGNGYIKDGKLYANGNGAIVVKAYNEKNTSIQGYAIVYVGQNVDALYDGYWTNVNGSITCDYWNPNLWGYDGYKINGWVLTNGGAYLPVISKVETTTSTTTGDTTTSEKTTTTIYSDLYDLLHKDYYGDVDALYRFLWTNGKLNPAVSGSEKWAAAMQEIVDDISADLARQIMGGKQ
ncbi:MAG: hypothetical protein IJX14_02910 [Clostridia bacterium]|nr:hypothetical protein [Clostridia bacterium]